MSLADLQKWDKKYAASDFLRQIDPDQELIRYGDLLPASGQALDLACGLGKNTLYLAQHGLNVTALDASVEGLSRLNQAAQVYNLSSRIHTVHADLDEYQIEEGAFDLIVVIRYLNRTLFSTIQAALKPGGVLLYKTFNRNVLKSRPHFNPSFTIEIDELQAGFGDLQVLQVDSDDSDYAFLLATNK